MKRQDTSARSAQDKCGIFGIVSQTGLRSTLPDAMYFGLLDLQHRGHEGAGMSISHNGVILTHKGMGTLDKVFNKHDAFDTLSLLAGIAGIGHVRYSTTGESAPNNLHPIEFQFHGKRAAVAHNGNLVNVEELEGIITSRGGYNFGGATTDTKCIAALISTSSHTNFLEALVETLRLLKGAFSLVLLYDDHVYAVKDEFGLRPLCVGYNAQLLVVASETCAFSTLGVTDVFELAPGALIELTPHGFNGDERLWTEKPSRYRSCVFEAIYLSRPDSILRGFRSVHILHKAMGRELLNEHFLHDADVVIGVPDSGIDAAIGYAEEFTWRTGRFIYGIGFIRPHYIGRSFIEPVKEKRKQYRDVKYKIIPEVVAGKNVVVVDDSIVRGTTMPKIVERLRQVGACKVYVLSASPPLRHPCHLGVDMPSAEDFIAHERTIEEIRVAINADYLGYLSLEGLYRAIGLSRDTFCDGCMTGDYPVVQEKSIV